MATHCCSSIHNSMSKQPRKQRLARHTAPLQRGDTVFAATEILGKDDYPERPDLGIAQTRLLGHKFDPEDGAAHEDAPPGFKKAPIFTLDRDIAVKRRAYYS